MKRKFTDEQLRELHAKGLTTKEIAQRFNCHRGTVLAHAGRLRLRFKRNVATRKNIDKQVKDLYAKCLTAREIAESLNCSISTVFRHAKELGLRFSLKSRNPFGLTRMEGETPEEYQLRYGRVYYQHNKERMKKYNKEWRRRNPERYKELRRQDYLRNREKILANQKERRLRKKALRELRFLFKE